MEAEQAEILRIGGSYEALQTSEAFIDLMQWLEDSCIALETKLTGISPENKEFFHGYFMEWQQRKLVILGIRARSENAIQRKQVAEGDLKNERPDDLGSSNSDTRFRGY